MFAMARSAHGVFRDLSRMIGAGLLAMAAALSTICGVAAAQDRFIVVASTTSTDNSGLFEHLLPIFTGRTGIEVRIIAVGTGQALGMARRGDADVLLVHDAPSELALMREGFGAQRREVMYNDFVVFGPTGDAAGIRGLAEAADALRRIAEMRAPFVSRGDDSGTHKAEVRLWLAAGIDAGAASGTWYRETGAGMGATLNIAQAMGAYGLADRATWTSFANRDGLEVLVEGDPGLFNQYSVILVNPKKFPHVKAVGGRAFMDWLSSPEGQRAIADFRVDGRQLFFPNAQGSKAKAGG